MRLEFKERKRSILEKIFVYPSFSLRFWVYSIILFVLICVPTLLIIPKISNWSNRLSGINIAIQGMTLIFAVVATYFALKQLTESRFTKLEEIGMRNLQSKKYFLAIKNWREALYIKPDSSVFFNLMETLLTAQQLKEFDELVGYLEKSKSFQQSIMLEPQDYIIFCYLKVYRNLIVENMGVSKGYLKEMTSFIQDNKIQINIGWNFNDIKDGGPYKKLTGDHKTVVDNLIKYLSGQLSPEEKNKFESNNYLLS